MRRRILAVRFVAIALATLCATASRPAHAEQPDSTATPAPPPVHVDTLAAGAAPQPPAPAPAPPPVPSAAGSRRGPVFLEFEFGWHRPESQSGELVLKSEDYGSMGMSVGGYPQSWLEILGDADLHWEFLQGPQVVVGPNATITGERSVSSTFVGLTGRFLARGPIGRPYVEVGAGIVSSTMSVEGTDYIGVFPLYIPIPYTESVRRSDPIARAGLGVRFPRESGMELGIDVRYMTLAESFGRLGRARVGGLTCSLMMRFHPASWFGGPRRGHRG